MASPEEYLPASCDVFTRDGAGLIEKEERKRKAEPNADPDYRVSLVYVFKYGADGGGAKFKGKWPASVVSLDWTRDKWGPGVYRFQARNENGGIVETKDQELESVDGEPEGMPGGNGHNGHGKQPVLWGMTIGEVVTLVRLLRDLFGPQQSNGNGAIETALAKSLEMQSMTTSTIQTAMASMMQAAGAASKPAEGEANRQHQTLLKILEMSRQEQPQIVQAPAPSSSGPGISDFVELVNLGKTLANPTAPTEPPEPDPPWVKALNNTVEQLGPPLAAIALSKAVGPEQASSMLLDMQREAGGHGPPPGMVPPQGGQQ